MRPFLAVGLVGLIVGTIALVGMIVATILAAADIHILSARPAQPVPLEARVAALETQQAYTNYTVSGLCERAYRQDPRNHC